MVSLTAFFKASIVNVREKEIAPQLAVSLSTSIIHVD
jgi:hypothetical protein